MSRPAIIRPLVCACGCGRPLPPASATGRPRRYFSDACRMRERRRRDGVPWPPVAPPGYPTDPETLRRRTAAALVAVMEGDSPAPPEDQLAQALLELDWLVFHVATLERGLPRRLAGRAAELARRIREARLALFAEAVG